MQRQHPGLVKRIVAIDIQPPTFKRFELASPSTSLRHSYFPHTNYLQRRQGFSFIPVLIFLGLVYQYWCILAFLLHSIPVVGESLGNALFRSQVYFSFEFAESYHFFTAQFKHWPRYHAFALSTSTTNILITSRATISHILPSHSFLTGIAPQEDQARNTAPPGGVALSHRPLLLPLLLLPPLLLPRALLHPYSHL